MPIVIIFMIIICILIIMIILHEVTSVGLSSRGCAIVGCRASKHVWGTDTYLPTLVGHHHYMRINHDDDHHHHHILIIIGGTDSYLPTHIGEDDYESPPFQLPWHLYTYPWTLTQWHFRI